MAHKEPLDSKTEGAIATPTTARAPWGGKELFIIALLGSLGAAGIIAGLNWRRMGFIKFMWPTIILSNIINIILIAAIAQSGGTALIGPANMVSVWGLILWQRPYYHMWKEINPEAQRAGWQIPVVTIVVEALAIFLFYIIYLILQAVV